MAAMLAAGAVSLFGQADARAAQTFYVPVPGTADVFAGGQAAVPDLDGGGGTLAPTVSFTQHGKEVVTFLSVTGAVYCDSSMELTKTAAGPCGDDGYPTELTAVGPISGINDPSNDFLTGVFLGPAQPTGAPPPALTFKTGQNGAQYSSLSPRLQQTFYVGTGRGVTAGTVQLSQVDVPAGATRLALGVADGYSFEGTPGYYSDDGGSYQATIEIAPAKVPGCPPPTGSVTGTSLGLLRLGMTRKQAHQAYSHSSNRGKRYQDFFCLTPSGVRVGYASPKLIKSVSRSRRKQLAGRVVWASTSDPYYAVDGIRPRVTLATAEARLPHGHLFHVGLNYWYLAKHGAVTAIFKVRHDVVEEIGIASLQVTGSVKAEGTFLTSFS
jgi:hypothetical protein